MAEQPTSGAIDQTAQWDPNDPDIVGDNVLGVEDTADTPDASSEGATQDDNAAGGDTPDGAGEPASEPDAAAEDDQPQDFDLESLLAENEKLREVNESLTRSVQHFVKESKETRQEPEAFAQPPQRPAVGEEMIIPESLEEALAAYNRPVPPAPEGSRYVRVHPAEDKELAGLVRDLSDPDNPIQVIVDGEELWTTQSVARKVMRAERAAKAEVSQRGMQAEAEAKERVERFAQFMDTMQKGVSDARRTLLPFIADAQDQATADRMIAGFASWIAEGRGITNADIVAGKKEVIDAAPSLIMEATKAVGDFMSRYAATVKVKEDTARANAPVKATGTPATPSVKPFHLMSEREQSQEMSEVLRQIEEKAAAG